MPTVNQQQKRIQMSYYIPQIQLPNQTLRGDLFYRNWNANKNEPVQGWLDDDEKYYTTRLLQENIKKMTEDQRRHILWGNGKPYPANSNHVYPALLYKHQDKWTPYPIALLLEGRYDLLQIFKKYFDAYRPQNFTGEMYFLEGCTIDLEGNNLLHIAIQTKNQAAIDDLAGRKYLKHSPNDKGDFPVSIALRKYQNDIELAKKVAPEDFPLLNKYPDMTAARLALFYGHQAFALDLVQHGDKVIYDDEKKIFFKILTDLYGSDQQKINNTYQQFQSAQDTYKDQHPGKRVFYSLLSHSLDWNYWNTALPGNAVSTKNTPSKVQNTPATAQSPMPKVDMSVTVPNQQTISNKNDTGRKEGRKEENQTSTSAAPSPAISQSTSATQTPQKPMQPAESKTEDSYIAMATQHTLKQLKLQCQILIALAQLPVNQSHDMNELIHIVRKLPPQIDEAMQAVKISQNNG